MVSSILYDNESHLIHPSLQGVSLGDIGFGEFVPKKINFQVSFPSTLSNVGVFQDRSKLTLFLLQRRKYLVDLQ